VKIEVLHRLLLWLVQFSYFLCVVAEWWHDLSLLLTILTHSSIFFAVVLHILMALITVNIFAYFHHKGICGTFTNI